MADYSVEFEGTEFRELDQFALSRDRTTTSVAGATGSVASEEDFTGSMRASTAWLFIMQRFTRGVLRRGCP
jgi:hypothetical protein